MTPDPAYVALALTRGVGAVRLEILLQALKSAEAVVRGSPDRIAALPGMTRIVAADIARATPDSGSRVIKRMKELGGCVLTPRDPAFPRRLLDIPDPPTILFAVGNVDLLQDPGVAIVGSRDHSAYGRRIADRLARGSARGGVTVISGMARGLDAVAHEGALDVGGQSVGVLGNGIGVVYPAANRALYRRMRQHGCLVTESPPDPRPNAGSFPRRNRIISGLARMVVVVEARPGSGALITADCALNQGRDVGAVPGPVDRGGSGGTNRLIQLGAKTILEPRDILEEFGVTIPETTPDAPPDLVPVERSVLELVGKGVSRSDDLSAAVGRGAGEMLTIMTGLEMRGLVARDPDGWRVIRN